MSKNIHSLYLKWNGPEISEVVLKLHDYNYRQILNSFSPQINSNEAVFQVQKTGAYLLEWQYSCQNKTFNSYYFLIDFPDITHINVVIKPEGAQFDEMGFYDDHNEFIDMLIYEGKKPLLTFPLEQKHLELTQWFLNEFKDTDPLNQKIILNNIFPDLSEAYPILSKLWGYQIRHLIDPILLAKTTPEWKALLLHTIRNHLILMDNESLYITMQEAINYALENKRVNELIDLMNWDSDKQDWHNEAQFINELKNKKILKES